MPVMDIEPKTHLYRFINFFDLYNIVKNKKLRMSKLSTMEDQNEGLGCLLANQEDILFRHNYVNSSDLKKYHNSIIHNTYVTCWTKEADMIAMWGLYSVDKSGIRIRTSAEKLLSSIERFHDTYSWAKYDGPLGGSKLLTWYCELSDVEYVDFYKLGDEIRRKYQEFEVSVKEKCKINPRYFDDKNEFTKDYLELQEQKVIRGNRWFLKDKSYQHEYEIRGMLLCGVRNKLTKEEWRRRKLDEPMLDLFEFASEKILPNFVYINVKNDFVEEICFDPRCPSYKTKVYIDILKEHSIQIVKSKAFGYALELESFASTLDGRSIELDEII